MKVLVIGYGSMGRRRIRLFSQIDSSAQFICVDSNPERLKQIIIDGYMGYSELNKALLEKPEIAFVCSSPLSHAEVIPVLLENNIDTFTEINLSSRKYDEMIRISKENDVNLFLSSTMLYKKQIQKIDRKSTRLNSSH